MSGDVIHAISRGERLAMTETGDLCRIETFIDEDGDETDDPEAAVFAVGPLPDGRWFCCDLRDFDKATVQ